jgi:hypothetical protein
MPPLFIKYLVSSDFDTLSTDQHAKSGLTKTKKANTIEVIAFFEIKSKSYFLRNHFFADSALAKSAAVAPSGKSYSLLGSGNA